MYCYTFAFDLHVLSTPPAFTLSQDQTLQLNLGTTIIVMVLSMTDVAVSLTHLRVKKKKLLECPHSSFTLSIFQRTFSGITDTGIPPEFTGGKEYPLL